jgi:peroxiredoxin
MNPLGAVLLAATVFAAPVLSAASAAAPAAKFGTLTAGTVAPEFTVVGTDGRDLHLADFKGRVLVLGFWTLSRGPGDLLASVALKYRDQQVAVLAVCTGATRSDFDAWVAKNRPEAKDHPAVDCVLAWDPAGPSRTERIAQKQFGAGVTPYTGVIDREGKVVGGMIGFGATASVVVSGYLREAGITVPDIEVPKRPSSDPIEDNSLKPGAVAPDFTTLDLKQQPVKLSDFAGKIVVLDFWATWCGPCIASMPHTQHVAEATKDKDVVVLASCTSDTRAKFEEWVRANQATYSALRFSHDPAERGPDVASRKLYGTSGIPTQFVIGRDGKIVAVLVGYGPGDSRLEQELEKLGVVVPGTTESPAR